jgi:hypothetical protein
MLVCGSGFVHPRPTLRTANAPDGASLASRVLDLGMGKKEKADTDFTNEPN